MQDHESAVVGQLGLGPGRQRCSGRCGRVLPLEDFYPYRWRRSGYTSRCKVCIRQDRKERYAERKKSDPDRLHKEQHKHYLSHRAQRLADATRYAESHREEIAAYNKFYRLNNAALLKEKRIKRYHDRRVDLRARQHVQYKKHRLKRLAAVKDYIRRNPDGKLAVQHARRARMMGAPGRWTASDIALIYKVQRGRCAYCLVALEGRYHRDHIVPLTAPGTSNWPWNIALTCQPCNNRKKDTSAGQYFARLIKERRAQTTV